jgi:hypothetical protein
MLNGHSSQCPARHGKCSHAKECVAAAAAATPASKSDNENGSGDLVVVVVVEKDEIVLKEVNGVPVNTSLTSSQQNSKKITFESYQEQQEQQEQQQRQRQTKDSKDYRHENELSIKKSGLLKVLAIKLASVLEWNLYVLEKE